jgi:transposase
MDDRGYAPAIQEMVRQGMLVRLATTVDATDPPSPVSRPRTWPTLVLLRALWHVARDDRAWLRLPPGSPPHQTVWSRLMGWRQRTVLDRALRVLLTCRRLTAGRKRQPTGAIINTQSVKTGPQRGLPLGVRVVSGEVQDRDALQALAPNLGLHASLLRLGWIALSRATSRPPSFRPTASFFPSWAAPSGREGFLVEPSRWKVEQTFGCLQRYRRLRVDDQMSHETSRHMTILASVFMTGMRLQRMLQT